MSQYTQDDDFNSLTNLENWAIIAPPSSSDIIWDMYLQDYWYSQNKVFDLIINMALLIIIVACVSPMAILDGIGDTEKMVKGVTGHRNFFYKLMCDQIAPIYLMIFNYIFIPFLVNQATKFLSFQLKSQVHTSLLWKFYIYYIFITIIL